MYRFIASGTIYSGTIQALRTTFAVFGPVTVPPMLIAKFPPCP